MSNQGLREPLLDSDRTSEEGSHARRSGLSEVSTNQAIEHDGSQLPPKPPPTRRLAQQVSNMQRSLMLSRKREQLGMAPSQEVGDDDVDAVMMRKTKEGHTPSVASHLTDVLQRHRQSPRSPVRFTNRSSNDNAVAVDMSEQSSGTDNTPFNDALARGGAVSFRESYRYEGPGMSRALSTAMTPKASMSRHMKHVMNRSIKVQAAAESKQRLNRVKIIFQVVWTLIFAVLACGAYYLDMLDRRLTTVWDIPVSSWLLVAATIFPCVQISHVMVSGIVVLLEWLLSSLDNVHFILIGLSTSLRILVTTLTTWVVVMFLIKTSLTKRSNTGPLVVFSSLCKCGVIFALVECVKSLSCRILSLRVHSETFFESLEDAFEKERVLNKLMKKVPDDVFEVGTRQAAQVARSRNIPESAVSVYLSDLHSLSLAIASSKAMSFTDRMTRLIRQFEDMSEKELDQHAAHAAEYFWWTSRERPEGNRLHMQDLTKLLNDPADVEFAFGLFDIDHDGFVVEEEVQQRFQQLYRERRNMAVTLQNTEVVIDTLESLVGGLMHACAVAAYLAIFKQPVTHILLSLSSVALTGAFIFGNSIRTVYESIVFLFMVRPYKVGDKIFYNGALHQVTSFGLIYTMTLRCDGCWVSTPNEKLMATDLVNVTKSKVLQDRISFECDAENVTPRILTDLSDSVYEMMIQDNVLHLFDQDFHPHAHINSVKDPLKFEIGLTYQLGFNGEKYQRVCDARSHINLVIGNWQKVNGITHMQSLQPGFLANAAGGGFTNALRDCQA